MPSPEAVDGVYDGLDLPVTVSMNISFDLRGRIIRVLFLHDRPDGFGEGEESRSIVDILLG